MQETNIRMTTKRRSEATRRDSMNRHLAVFFTVALAVVCIAADANAQAAVAKMHVDAAKAAVAAKDNNPKVAPFHNYQALFDQMCAEPKLPDTVRQEQDR